MNKQSFLILFFFLAFFYLLPYAKPAYAAVLKFEPSSITTNVGETFELNVVVDTDKDILGVDALLQYPSDLIELQSITDGTFLEIAETDSSQQGKIYAAGVIKDAGTVATGQGNLVKLLFKAKAGGSGKLTYVCEAGQTNESNISENVPDATDIIDCSSNGEAVVTIGGQTQTTPRPTPSRLPRSGIAEDFMLYATIGGVFFALGIAAKLLLKV